MDAVAAPSCWAYQKAGAEQIEQWVGDFHRDGFLFLENVLTPEMCAELRADLDRVSPPRHEKVEVALRMFEQSAANLALFDLEPIVSLAEALIGEDEALGKESCHVVHNNSFRSNPDGGISGWHQDDSSHYKVTHGEPPENIHLPVLLLTVNYYLTDVTELAHGPFQAVRGSHKFGARPPADVGASKWSERIASCYGGAGTAMFFNNQTWHRGAPNTSQRPRCVTQVSYGRRLIGHKYHPFMNYVMPEHCYKDADPRRKRLLGFLPSGAYG